MQDQSSGQSGHPRARLVTCHVGDSASLTGVAGDLVTIAKHATPLTIVSIIALTTKTILNNVYSHTTGLTTLS